MKLIGKIDWHPTLIHIFVMVNNIMIFLVILQLVYHQFPQNLHLNIQYIHQINLFPITEINIQLVWLVMKVRAMNKVAAQSPII